MLTQIDDYQKQLKDYNLFGPDFLPKIRDFYRVGLTYTSTALEGGSYTQFETKVLLEEGLTADGKPLRDALDIVGHAKAYDYMFRLLCGKILLNRDLLNMHVLLRENSHFLLRGNFENEEVGEYRTKQVLPAIMDKFENWMSTTRTVLHPVAFAVELHLKLILIQPFTDNNRIARLAMNAVLLQEGYLPLVVPPALQSEYITCMEKIPTAENKTGYLRNDYLQFMYKQEIETQSRMLRMLKGTNETMDFSVPSAQSPVKTIQKKGM